MKFQVMQFNGLFENGLTPGFIFTLDMHHHTLHSRFWSVALALICRLEVESYSRHYYIFGSEKETLRNNFPAHLRAWIGFTPPVLHIIWLTRRPNTKDRSLPSIILIRKRSDRLNTEILAQPFPLWRPKMRLSQFRRAAAIARGLLCRSKFCGGGVR